MTEETPAVAEVSKFTPYQNFLVVLLTALQFTVVLGFAVMSPLGDMIMKDLSIDTVQFGLLISGYAFGAGFAGIFAAAIADKFDRKKFLLFFYAGFLAGMVLCGFADSYLLLLTARTVTGIFGGVINSIALAIVADLFALNQRGRVMGYIQMAFSVSQIVGIPVGLILANQWGWNAAFLVIAALSVFIGLLIIFKMKPINAHLQYQKERKEKENVLLHLKNILTLRHYFAGYLLITLVTIGGAMLMPFSAPFLINNVNVTQQQLPIVYLVTGIASIFIMIFIGKLSDKYPKKRVFLAGTLITIVMTIIYTNLTPIPLWFVIAINILMFTGTNGRLIPAMALNTAVPDPAHRGAYMSLCSALQQFANGFGAIIAGMVIVQAAPSAPLMNFNIVGYIVCGVSIICIFLVYRVSKDIESNRENVNGKM